MGISGRFHSCIQSFLTKRTLRIKVGEGFSKFIEVTNRTPQASVLGPIVFLLYINDCLNGLLCDAVVLSDDMKIWQTLECPFAVQSLQINIDGLSTQPRAALMGFNKDKRVVLILHPRQAKDRNCQYQLNEGPLKCVRKATCALSWMRQSSLIANAHGPQ